jgi:dihydromethanopterin reductase (acceptor)
MKPRENAAKRIAWAITGAGHALRECIEAMRLQGEVDVFLSRAAEEVLSIYKLNERLEASGMRVYREGGASSPIVGRFFKGMYRVLVVAPATSNSVAKFVCGVSDTLVTNLFAQAGKSRVPILVYPTDLAREMDSLRPDGQPVKVFPRTIDLENTGRLRSIEGVHVVNSLQELGRLLSAM